MKSTRKLASLLLALVMVFALATTAFATEAETPTPATGTITVANPVKDQSYTAYKIFDVVYDDQDHYSYTIGNSNPWYDTVAAYAATEGNGLKLTQVNGGDTYVVTTVNGFSAPDFAAALKKAINGKPGRPLSENANSVSVSGLDLGYYFVASASGALCNLTTTNPTVTIHDKNDMPFEKTADATDVEVGQTVNYTIKGKVPDTTGFDKYTYEITDTMSDGLTFNGSSLAVKVGSADVTADTDKCTITYEATTAPNTFKVTIKAMNCKVGDDIVVTYNATVNEKAIAVVSENKAELTYSNNPADSESKTTTPPEIVKVYSSKIVIDKYEAGKEGTKLPNAQFVLYKEVISETGSSTLYYKWNETDKKVEWVADMTAADVVKTDNDGAAYFKGLTNGDYYLVETKAPDGYNQLTEPHKVTVAGSITDATKLSVTAKVENQAGTLLPSTGGMGTTVFYVLGAILVVGAGVLLVTKKRMSQGEV